MSADENSTDPLCPIGSPQWRHKYEQFRMVAQFLKTKLADDRQYLTDPMMRADDRAMLQHIEDSLAVFKLEEELLTNPAPARAAEINLQRATFSQTQEKTFRFLQRLGEQQSQRFEQARKLHEAAVATESPKPPSSEPQPAQQGKIQKVTQARITLAAALRLQGWKDYPISKALYPERTEAADAYNVAKSSIFKPYEVEITAEQTRLAALPPDQRDAEINAAKAQIQKGS
jgi:hypothetical protein